MLAPGHPHAEHAAEDRRVADRQVHDLERVRAPVVLDLHSNGS